MQVYNTKTNFGIMTIFIHWIMAIFIVGLFILGKIMHDLDYYDPNYHVYPWWHKSFGLTIAFMLILRLFWKWKNPTVAEIKSIKPIQLKLAKIVHAILYILILICCISGVMISTAEGAGIEFFGWFEIPAILANGELQAELAGEIHEASTLALILFAVLHLLATLKHHFIDKNATLKRMLSTKTIY